MFAANVIYERGPSFKKRRSHDESNESQWTAYPFFFIVNVVPLGAMEENSVINRQLLS